MDDVLETELWQRLLVNEYVFSDNRMKQNDTNTQLKDKFKSAAVKRNHYQATIIFQDSHKSDFLALPQSVFNWRQGRDTWQMFRRCKNWGAASRESTKAAEGSDSPKRGQLGHSCDATVVIPKKIFLENCHEVWHLHFEKKCEMLERIQREERSKKNPKAFVAKSEGKSLCSLLGE